MITQLFTVTDGSRWLTAIIDGCAFYTSWRPDALEFAHADALTVAAELGADVLPADDPIILGYCD